MKEFIKKFLLKQILLGSLAVKTGTVVATAAAVIVVGTAVGVIAVNGNAPKKEPVLSVAETLAESLTGETEQTDNETPDETGNQDSNPADTPQEESNENLSVEEPAQEAHVHTFTTEIISQSTCTTRGEAVDTCSECGYSHSYQLPLAEHKRGEWTVVSEATQTKEGLREQHCNDCGTLLASEVIAVIPHNHTYVVTSSQGASCEKDGYNRYTCTICGSFFAETIGAVGHKYDEQIVENATCTTAGHVYKRCTVCGKTLETEVLAATGHAYGEWTTVKAATCTEAGEEARRCTSCGLTENRTVAAKGHTEGERTITKEATCTEAGAYTYTCTVCNTKVENNEIAPLGHIFGEPDVVDSTCSAEGNRKFSCTRENCGYFYEEVIAKKDHTESDWIDNNPDLDKAPTCTETGRRHTECKECHAVIRTEEIPATGHSFGAWTTVTAPACESAGEEKRICQVCAFEETRTIAALGHNYQEIIDTPATCEQTGTKHMECSTCHDKKQESTIPALGHKFVNYVEVTSATDLTEGLERATCENGCGKTDDRIIEKLPHTHNYDTEKERVEAECTKDGYYIMECRCGSTMKVDIPKTGHSYEKTRHVDANCILDGSDTYTCTKCNDTYSEKIDATGHSAGEWEIVKEATDLEEGQQVRKCTSCGTILETQAISKLPHTCEHTKLLESQPSTCTTDGYELYECRCGLTDKVILPKTNHKNAEWKTTKEATYTEMGLREKICPDCLTTIEKEDIPVKPHEHTYTVTSSTEATCTEAGTTVKACSICGNTTTVVTPATGHTEGAFVVDKEATCTETGTKHTECSVCHITLTTETIPAAGHTEGDWTVAANATCTTDGSKQTKCTKCDTVMRTETIPATGHFLNEWHETAAAECETAGTEQRNCSNCSYVESRSIPALGHDYGDWIIDKEATEESEGEKHKECSRCDSKITEDIEKLPPHVHSYTETARIDSTCSKTGTITYTCDCGDSYTEEIAKKAHTPGGWTVKTPATEESTGLEVKICSVCQTETDSRVIDKLPHTHKYTTETKPATCTEDGYEKQTCACGSIINTVLPATGHEYADAVVVDATCTEKGTSTITCKKCSHQEVTDIPATGHHYVESEKTAATCGQAGSVTYKCSNCGDTYSEPIDQLEHDYAVTSTVEATCTEGGYTLETCKNCGDTQKTNETEAVGHDDGEWTTTAEAQLGVAGSKELRCTKCQALLDTQEIPMLMTDGTDSVYYYEVRNEDGTVSKEFAIGHYNEEEAQQMLELVNAHRETLGAAILTTPSGRMPEYTALRAVETSKLWDHARPSGYGSEYRSENIAMGPPDGKGVNPSVQRIFDAWLASEGHRNNIEYDNRQKNWTSISVFYKRCPVYKNGVETGQYVYTAYWVETFK